MTTAIIYNLGGTVIAIHALQLLLMVQKSSEKTSWGDLVVYLPLFTTGFSTIPNGGFLHQISEPSTGTIDDTEKSYQLQNGAFCFKDMFILPTIIFFQGKNPSFWGRIQK